MQLARTRLVDADDGYLDRIAKYVPVEVISAHIAITGLAKVEAAWLVGAAAVCWIAVPLYVWRLGQGEPPKPWKMHAVLASIAFPIWALATSPPLAAHFKVPDYAPAVGVILFTLLAGLISPPAGRRVATPSH